MAPFVLACVEWWSRDRDPFGVRARASCRDLTLAGGERRVAFGPGARLTAQSDLVLTDGVSTVSRCALTATTTFPAHLIVLPTTGTLGGWDSFNRQLRKAPPCVFCHGLSCSTITCSP